MSAAPKREPDEYELFDEAAEAARDPILADTASLKAAWLLMDAAPLADIEARLTPLAEDDRPMHAFAQHALALARLQHGKTAEARSALVVLQLGQDVPDAVRQQAQAAIALIDSGTAAALPGVINAAKNAPATSAPAAQSPAAPAAPAVLATMAGHSDGRPRAGSRHDARQDFRRPAPRRPGGREGVGPTGQGPRVAGPGRVRAPVPPRPRRHL